MRAVTRTQVRTVDSSTLPVTLEEAKLSLRVDGDALDPLITTWIKGVVKTLEHEVGQCIMEQTWEVRLDGFPGEIQLPHPTSAIQSLKYRSSTGVLVDLPVEDVGLERGRYRSIAYPLSGCWPAALSGRGAVVLTVKAGYGNAPEATPENVRLYILAKLVDQFDPATQSEKGTAQSPFLARLLDACRSDP